MALAISPTPARATPNGRVNFSASGGTPPYTYAVSSNRSGGSVSSTGLYIAGPHGLVTDVVTVTDSVAATADAHVQVSAGLYQRAQQLLAPPRLKLPNGQVVLGDFGAEKDWQFERARQGILSNLPGYCQPDALDTVAQERQLPRAGWESADAGGSHDQAYAERLRTCWTSDDGWSVAGNYESVLRALDRAGFPMGTPSGCHVIQRYVRYGWLTASQGSVAYGTHPTWKFDNRPKTFWSQFGILFGADVPGLTAGSASAKLLNRLVDTWKPSKALFMGTIVVETAPVWGWPIGTLWGDVGLVWGGGSSSRRIPPDDF